MSEATRLLERVQHGEPQAAKELLPLIYEELRKLAAAKLTQEPSGQTLQPTALVHEVWLRLVGNQGQNWNGRREVEIAHTPGSAPQPCPYWFESTSPRPMTGH